jgi:tRNA-splicing ligase RtcB (3'-phosphate/5'-hydroxy nucleic acid ligase)
MTESSLPSLRIWLAGPLGADVSGALDRLRTAPDVQHVAVMPDVHLAADVCVGVVVATSHLIYPQAVGSDIGCGMLAVAFDIDANRLGDPRVAAGVLAGIGRAVPAARRNRDSALPQPADLMAAPLSHSRVDAVRRREGAVEFATLGSGNHFVELQADEDGRLWLMLHTGSRAVGQAIRNHHMERAEGVGGTLKALDARTEAGQAYLADASWARRFAHASRTTIAEEVGKVLLESLGARLCWETAIAVDHNYVALEQHEGRELWVHRKGAMRARTGESGVLPGSMGTPSYHVEGRGEAGALCSSAHGAGRLMSRSAARRHVTLKDVSQQLRGVWYDYRHADDLRDEAPSAYKDIRAVIRAQHDLVKVTRTLRPVLNYKGI